MYIQWKNQIFTQPTIFLLFRNGFGDVGVDGNCYIGNQLIHLITQQRQYTLKIDITDFTDSYNVATYKSFSVDDEEDGYRLHVYMYNGKIISRAQSSDDIFNVDLELLYLIPY